MAAGPPPLTSEHVVASVAEIHSANQYFIRVVLAVPDVDRLRLPSGADTAVGVYFGATLSAPARTYTVRRDDRHNGGLVIDILMHGAGVGTAWARQVTEGDTVVLAHANSWYQPPPATDWQLLVADMAGLPALARILDEPPLIATTVLVESADGDDLAYLPSRREVTVVSVPRGTLPQRVSRYTRADGAGYCWFAGEASDARVVRKHLRREMRWQQGQLDVMGYWRRDSAQWDSRFASVGAGLYAVYTKALDDGKSAKDAMEAFDEALEQAGL